MTPWRGHCPHGAAQLVQRSATTSDSVPIFHCEQVYVVLGGQFPQEVK